MKTALILLIQNMVKKEIDIINNDKLFMYNDLNMKIK